MVNVTSNKDYANHDRNERLLEEVLTFIIHTL